jgi:hypothetical protein
MASALGSAVVVRALLAAWLCILRAGPLDAAGSSNRDKTIHFLASTSGWQP